MSGQIEFRATYRNTIISIVTPVQGAVLRSTKVGKVLVTDGVGGKGIADDCLPGEVLRKRDVGDVGERATERVSGRFNGVVGVLLDQRLDLRDHIIVHGRPWGKDAVHHLGAGGEVDTRQAGLDQGGVDVVGNVGCCR